MHVPYGYQHFYPQQPQQQPQPSQYPQAQPHMQVQHPHPSTYPQQAYGQMQQPMPMQQPTPQPYASPLQQISPSWGNVQLPSLGRNVPNPFAAINAKASGLPAPLAFGLALVAVFVALVFDVVFLKVSVPGVGGYAWYLTTALSFMAAGYGSMMWTRAGKTLSFVAVGIAAVIYGVCDVGLGLVLEDLSLSGAIVLGAQGVAIGFFTGFGGVYRALRAKSDD